MTKGQKEQTYTTFFEHYCEFRRSKQVKQEEESICYNHNYLFLPNSFFHLENVVNVEMEIHEMANLAFLEMNCHLMWPQNASILYPWHHIS